MNNTPDYIDNLYFEEEKMDCKNCPYTDEYCASGDCERNADVSKTLTEKWKKGELEVGEEYWVILTNEWYLQRPVAPVRAFYSCDHEFEGYYDNDIKEVLAPVPSYEEWKEKLRALDAAHKAIKMEDETINRLVCSGKQLNYENAKLKDLLKECFEYIDWTDGTGSPINQQKLLDKIDEVIK